MLIASLTATIGVMDWVLFNNGMESRGYSENHETLGRFDAVFGGLIPVTLVLSFVSIAFAEAFAGQEGIPTDSTALCNALVSVIPSIWIQLGFYIGIIALVCSSMIGLSVTCATSFYQSTNVKKDTKAWYHPFIVLAPQIGFLGAFFGKPVMVVVFIAAMQSLFNWISGNSWYLLGNDPRYLGKKVIQSRFFNAGILACISVLNIVSVSYTHLNEDYDFLLVVCDATCLERGLYLLSQAAGLLEHREEAGPMPQAVLCVNLCDEAEKKGIRIDFKALERSLGIPVTPCCGRTAKGLLTLKKLLASLAASCPCACASCSLGSPYRRLPSAFSPKDLAAQAVTYTKEHYRKRAVSYTHLFPPAMITACICTLSVLYGFIFLFL